jgi:hypothetical protein
MSHTWLVVVALLPLLVVLLLVHRSRRTHGPRIVHLIYLPWTRDQVLKSDPYDFDHTFEQRLRALQEPRGWTVRMWTGPELQKEFPKMWTTSLKESARPTQMVDLFRWAVVARYGGVYLQYGTRVHNDNLDRLRPSSGHTVKLFTERVLTTEQCQEAGRRHTIRRGVPEEPVRVMNQVFSASVVEHPFIVRCRDTILRNMVERKPVHDYDILYLGANALVSTLYDVWGTTDRSVQLVGEASARRTFTVSSHASWRKEPL